MKKYNLILCKVFAVIFICCLVFVSFTGCYGGTTLNNSNATTQQDTPVYNETNPGEIYYEKTAEENVSYNEETGSSFADNEILVISEDNVTYEDMEALAQTYSAEIVGYIELSGDYQWKLNAKYTEEELDDLVEQIEKSDLVVDASLNYMFETEIEMDQNGNVTNDTEWIGLWNESQPDGFNWGVEAINAPAAWRKYYSDLEKSPVKVGVFDACFEVSHDDLDYVETFFNPDMDALKRGATADELSDLSHGTHVSGIIGAKFDNSRGIAGVNPFASKGMYAVSYKGLYNYSENTSSLTGTISSVGYKCAFAELIVRNVKVINVSLNTGRDTALAATKGVEAAVNYISKNAIEFGNFLQRLLKKNYDFVIVIAAGNCCGFIEHNVPVSTAHPFGWYLEYSRGNSNVNAVYNNFANFISTPEVKNRIIVVGSAGYEISNGVVEYSQSRFSNSGSRVDVIAPGEDIHSCVVNDNYDTKSGTSMATPHVTGLASMIWSLNNNLSGAEVKNIITSTANIDVTGTNKKMINAIAALDVAAAKTTANVSTAPENCVVIASVKNKNEELIPEASIEAILDSTGEVVQKTTADSNGRFELIIPDAGTYTLAVTADDYNITEVKDVTVKNGEVVYLDWVVLTKELKDFTLESPIGLRLGEVYAIEPEIEPSDAEDYTFKWTSSDDNIVIVSPEGQNGIITACSAGSITISAEYTNKKSGDVITRTCEVEINTQGRDTVLVLDISGSMDGTPMNEMKEAAIKFCTDLLSNKSTNRVGLVYYDSSVSEISLTNDLDLLKSSINSIYSGGLTDMEAGLLAAEEMMNSMSSADNINNIVIMADGLPNDGATSSSDKMANSTYYYAYEYNPYANAVIDRAESIMSKYNLYSLGFFHSLYDEEKDYAVELMQKITNKTDGYHQVDNAEDIEFAFGDIAETISSGAKIVINIACPIDVDVTYNGETLSSAQARFNALTSFGNLQLLGKNKDIKVLTLTPDIDYDITLSGTDTGTMDYSINYFGIDEKLNDYRTFLNVPLTNLTKIFTSTSNESEVSLDIDNNSDGTIDEIWIAGTQKSYGSVSWTNQSVATEPETTQTEPEVTTEIQLSVDTDASDSTVTVLLVAILLVVVIVVILVLAFGLSNNSNSDSGGSDIPVVYNHYERYDGHYRVRKDNNSSVVKPDETVPIKADETTPLASAALRIESGSMKGQRIVIGTKKIYVGKDPQKNNLVLSKDYIKVSRSHCIIEYSSSNDKYFVVDLSRNGTYRLNKTRIEKGKRVAFDHDSKIYLADEDCVIILE